MIQAVEQQLVKHTMCGRVSKAHNVSVISNLDPGYVSYIRVCAHIISDE